jgi:hypothetical protein
LNFQIANWLEQQRVLTDCSKAKWPLWGAVITKVSLQALNHFFVVGDWWNIDNQTISKAGTDAVSAVNFFVDFNGWSPNGFFWKDSAMNFSRWYCRTARFFRYVAKTDGITTINVPVWRFVCSSIRNLPTVKASGKWYLYLTGGFWYQVKDCIHGGA